MDYAPRRWALNSLGSMLLLAIGLNMLKELALRSWAWLFDWTCFWPSFGYSAPEVYVALHPVIPVAHSIAQSEGCLNARLLLPVVLLGIALMTGVAFQHTERRRLRAVWIIVPLAFGLAFLRTLAVVAYDSATWPFTYYRLEVPFPFTVMNEYALGGIFLIDVGFLLWGIALGRRISHGRRAAGGERE